MQDFFEFIAFSVIASIVVLVVVVATSEWLRERREREIYRQTRQGKAS